MASARTMGQAKQLRLGSVPCIAALAVLGCKSTDEALADASQQRGGNGCTQNSLVDEWLAWLSSVPASKRHGFVEHSCTSSSSAHIRVHSRSHGNGTSQTPQAQPLPFDVNATANALALLKKQCQLSASSLSFTTHVKTAALTESVTVTPSSRDACSLSAISIDRVAERDTLLTLYPSSKPVGKAADAWWHIHEALGVGGEKAAPSHAHSVYRSSNSYAQNRPRSSSSSSNKSKLEELGARVFLPSSERNDESASMASSINDPMDWGLLVGYEHQLNQIEETILVGLLHQRETADMSKRARGGKADQASTPKGLLLEGPPGTGKTEVAKQLAHRCGCALVYVPIEALMSAYYGQTSSRMSSVLRAAHALSEELPGVIIFLDELDSLVSARGAEQGMHEESKRVLGVLLRSMEGMEGRGEGESAPLVLGATNRKRDLDEALLSRFDTVVSFPKPDKITRARIFNAYATQLTERECSKLAEGSDGFTGRDIRDACAQAERTYAAHCLRKQQHHGRERETSDSPALPLPPFEYYRDAVNSRKEEIS